jgi:DNA-directed RNA polymerase specialized sigma24 family protein
MDQVYVEKLYSAKRMTMEIEKVYENLKPWEEKVLRWKYEEGWSVKKIASEMDWSIKAAESRLFRARQAFQAVYAAVDSS